MQGVTNVDLVGRPKNLYAVWKKMQNKGKSLKDMYDLRALRIVVRGGKAACYDILQKVRAPGICAQCGITTNRPVHVLVRRAAGLRCCKPATHNAMSIWLRVQQPCMAEP